MTRLAEPAGSVGLNARSAIATVYFFDQGAGVMSAVAVGCVSV